MADHVLAELSSTFVIQREVRGEHCSGKRLRLDAVLHPRDPSGWRDDSPAFGVEFKQPGPNQGMNAWTRWAAQSVDYTHVDWERWGRLMIFTCPPVTAGVSSQVSYAVDNAWLMARLLGQLNVGELGRTIHGWTLTINGESLWSERYGVHRKWSLAPRAGSR
jgi:hypothetical protein